MLALHKAAGGDEVVSQSGSRMRLRIEWKYNQLRALPEVFTCSERCCTSGTVLHLSHKQALRTCRKQARIFDLTQLGNDIQVHGVEASHTLELRPGYRFWSTSC